MRLALERNVNGQGRLVLRYAPWSDEPGGIDWARAPWQTLSDLLSDGKSYFYAEINRLRTIMEQLEKAPCFVLLDELF